MNKIVIKKPSLICYDWDNTLINTNVLCMQTFNELFTELGMPNIDQMELDRINGYVFDEYLKEKFGDKYLEIKKQYMAAYDKNSAMLQPLNKALDVVSMFHNAGIKQIIISNKHGSMVREEAKRMGFDKYIDNFYGMDDSGIAKPDAKFFDFVKEKEGIVDAKFDIDNLMFFGDSSVDINFARNINAKLVFIGPEYILNQCKYEHSIYLNSYNELIDNIEIV